MLKFIRFLSIGSIIVFICVVSGGIHMLLVAAIMAAFIWWLIQMNKIGEHNEAYRKAGLNTREVLISPSTPEEIAQAKQANIPPACNEAYLSENQAYNERVKNSYYPKCVPSCWYDYLELDPEKHVMGFIAVAPDEDKWKRAIDPDFRSKAQVIWNQLHYAPMTAVNMENVKQIVYDEEIGKLKNEGKEITNDVIEETKYLSYKIAEQRYRNIMESNFNNYLRIYNFYGRLKVDFYYRALEEFIQNGKGDHIFALFRTNSKYEQRLKEEKGKEKEEIQ